MLRVGEIDAAEIDAAEIEAVEVESVEVENEYEAEQITSETRIGEES